MAFILGLIGRYSLLAKGIALLVMLIALWGAWHAFTGHYKAIGVAECQKSYQLAVDAKAKADKIAFDKAEALRKIASEQHDSEQAAILNNWINLVKSERVKNVKTSNDLQSTSVTLNELRNAIRTSTMPNRQGSGQDAIESGGELDPTLLRQKLEVCETAAAIETSDYNKLYQDFQANCRETGCK